MPRWVPKPFSPQRSRSYDAATILERKCDAPVAPEPDTCLSAKDTIAEPSENHVEPATYYPEGGLAAWSVVIGSWCAMMSTFGLSNAMGTMQAWLVTHQLADKSNSTVSWIFSIWLALMFLGSVFVGPIFDRYGVRCLLAPGSAVLVVSIFILSWCKEYYQFILGFSLLGGASASLIFNPSVTVIGHWFLKRRALATGLAVSGGAIGGIVFPLVLSKLYEKVGYGWATRVIGFIILFLLLVSNALLRARHDVIREKDVKWTLVDFKALRIPSFLATTFGVILIEWAFFVPVNYLVVYAQSLGHSVQFANSLLAYLNAASVFGRAIPGYMGDRLGCFNVLTVNMVCCGLAPLVIWLPAGHSTAGLIVFSCFFGFFSGCSISLAPVCISHISDTKDYGKRYGTCYSLCSIATLTGLPISGALISGNFHGLIIFSGVVFLFSGVSFAVARFLAVGTKLKF